MIVEVVARNRWRCKVILGLSRRPFPRNERFVWNEWWQAWCRSPAASKERTQTQRDRSEKSKHGYENISRNCERVIHLVFVLAKHTAPNFNHNQTSLSDSIIE